MLRNGAEHVSRGASRVFLVIVPHRAGEVPEPPGARGDKRHGFLFFSNAVDGRAHCVPNARLHSALVPYCRDPLRDPIAKPREDRVPN